MELYITEWIDGLPVVHKEVPNIEEIAKENNFIIENISEDINTKIYYIIYNNDTINNLNNESENQIY